MTATYYRFPPSYEARRLLVNLLCFVYTAVISLPTLATFAALTGILASGLITPFSQNSMRMYRDGVFGSFLALLMIEPFYFILTQYIVKMQSKLYAFLIYLPKILTLTVAIGYYLKYHLVGHSNEFNAFTVVSLLIVQALYLSYATFSKDLNQIIVGTWMFKTHLDFNYDYGTLTIVESKNVYGEYSPRSSMRVQASKIAKRSNIISGLFLRWSFIAEMLLRISIMATIIAAASYPASIVKSW
jgi:hypothetical protein